MLPLSQELVVEGGQLELILDGMQLMDIQGGSWDLKEKHWNEVDGRIRISLDQTSLSNGPAFALVVVPNRSGYIKDMIRLTADFDQEVYLGEDLSVSKVKLRFLEASSGEWTAFPNPSDGEVTILGPGIPDAIEVHSIYGQLISTSESSRVSLDQGTYLVKIKKDGEQWIKKVIVR